VGLLKKLSSIFGGRGGEEDVHREYVRCTRCGEVIPVRVDLRRELTPSYEDEGPAYHVHKGVMGSGTEQRCFQRIDVRLTFDERRHLLSRDVSGGAFVTREEYEAQTD
jgi:hypothetical protein